jgi:hypothetical protein
MSTFRVDCRLRLSAQAASFISSQEEITLAASPNSKNPLSRWSEDTAEVTGLSGAGSYLQRRGKDERKSERDM